MPELESTTKAKATYVLAVSIFAMAAALIFFTIQLASISRQIPDILNSVQSTSSKIEPMLKEMGNVRDLVPPILEEIKHSREQIPPILNEVAQLREQLPLILEETKQTRQLVPGILDTVNNVVKEVEKTRPLVPQVLTQVEKTREAMPGMLDKADKLVANAKQAGKEASQGAVTGVLTGIIAAPFNIVGNLGKKMLGISDEDMKKLTEQDINIMTQTGETLLSSDQINLVREWDNPDSQHNGKLTLKNIIKASADSNNKPCKDIHLQVWKQNTSIVDKMVTYCLDENNNWNPR